MDNNKNALNDDILEKISGGNGPDSLYVSACQTCGKIFRSEAEKEAHASEHPDHVIVCFTSKKVVG